MKTKIRHICPECKNELVIMCYKKTVKNFKVEQIIYTNIHKKRYCPNCDMVYVLSKVEK